MRERQVLLELFLDPPQLRRARSASVAEPAQFVQERLAREQYLDAVQAREVLVRERAAELFPLEQSQRLLCIAGEPGGEPLLRQQPLEEVEDDGLVVDHQHRGEGSGQHPSRSVEWPACRVQATLHPPRRRVAIYEAACCGRIRLSGSGFALPRATRSCRSRKG